MFYLKIHSKKHKVEQASCKIKIQDSKIVLNRKTELFCILFTKIMIDRNCTQALFYQTVYQNKTVNFKCFLF